MSRTFAHIAFPLSALFAVGSTVAYGAAKYESPSTQVHLIELYSSEGCSSCPSAEAWLRTLRANSDLWKTFVPVEFHIDYWNRLGWHDPFSEEKFSDRQRDLAHEWGAQSVYTPGFALDGAEWRPAYVALRLPKSAEVGVLRAERTQPEQYTVHFHPSAPSRTKLRVYGALLGNGFTTVVKAGENSGQTLRHDFVVTQFTETEMSQVKATSDWTATIHLSGKSATTPESQSVVFWVTEVGHERPLQTVGGPL
jgi:hypothetical protein